MPYIIGKNARLFMVCENSGSQIDCTGSAAAAADIADTTIGVNNTKAGIGFLGAVADNTDVEHMVPNMEGVSYSVSFENDSFHPFGLDMDQDVEMRKTCELTINKKKTNNLFRKLYSAARYGVKSDTTLYDSADIMDNGVGFRFILYDGSSEYLVLYHGIMSSDGYEESVDPGKITTETIKFHGNYWNGSVAAAALGTPFAIY